MPLGAKDHEPRVMGEIVTVLVILRVTTNQVWLLLALRGMIQYISKCTIYMILHMILTYNRALHDKWHNTVPGTDTDTAHCTDSDTSIWPG